MFLCKTSMIIRDPSQPIHALQRPNNSPHISRMSFPCWSTFVHCALVVIAWYPTIKHSPNPISRRRPTASMTAENHWQLQSSAPPDLQIMGQPPLIWQRYQQFETHFDFDRENIKHLFWCLVAGWRVKPRSWSSGFDSFWPWPWLSHLSVGREVKRIMRSGVRDQTYSWSRLNDQVFSCSSLVIGSGYWIRSSLMTF